MKLHKSIVIAMILASATLASINATWVRYEIIEKAPDECAVFDVWVTTSTNGVDWVPEKIRVRVLTDCGYKLIKFPPVDGV